MTDTRWTVESGIRWKKNRSPEQTARAKGRTKRRRLLLRSRRLELVTRRATTARARRAGIHLPNQHTLAAGTVVASPETQLAFQLGCSRRDARIRIQDDLRKKRGYA